MLETALFICQDFIFTRNGVSRFNFLDLKPDQLSSLLLRHDLLLHGPELFFQGLISLKFPAQTNTLIFKPAEII